MLPTSRTHLGKEKKERMALRETRLRLAAPLLVLVTLRLAAANATTSSDWPHWRGPTGNGVSLDADPPRSWSPSGRFAWKVPIPGDGTASPIVWRDRVYVSSAIPEGAADAQGADGKSRNPPGGSSQLIPHRFVLLALDRADGKIVWQQTAASVRPEEGHHPDHGFASSSPCTDGERVYAHFGSRGIFAYDLEGKPVWKRTDLGSMKTRNGFGEGSSPALHGDLVIIPWDHEGPSYITAIDKRTGATVWKTDRDEPSSWGTPLVVDAAGGPQVVTTGERFVRGYDLKTGKELWRASGQTGRPIPSPVAGDGLVFAAPTSARFGWTRRETWPRRAASRGASPSSVRTSRRRFSRESASTSTRAGPAFSPAMTPRAARRTSRRNGSKASATSTPLPSAPPAAST
jgi:outer membrane protein assembly factor BamB